MRVRSSFAAIPASHCNLQTGLEVGEAEDYNVEVIAATDATIDVSDVTICAGTNTQITATSSGTVRWYFSQNSTIAIFTGQTFTTPVLNNSTTYWVQSSVGSCLSPKVPVVVTVVPPFAVNVTASQNPVCSGTPFSLTANSAGTGLTYVWTPAASFNNTSQNPATATITANTTFNVVATDAAGCTGNGSLAVTVLPAPTVNVNATQNSICQGASTTLTASGAGPTYTWSPSTGLSSTSGATVTANPSVTTTYTVSSPASAGSCAATGSITVTVNSAPTINAGSDVSVCNGSSTNLSASGAASYSWSPILGLGNANSGNTSASPTATTVYTVTGTSAAGCISTDAVTVTVNPLPIANPGLGAANCSGLGAQLNGSGGATYLWSPATGLSSTTIANPIASPAVTTNYTLVVTDASGCVSAPSNSVTVTVFQQPPAPNITIVGTTTFCAGGSVQLNAPASAEYLWSNGATTQSINVSSAGNYTVRITDANGCLSPSSPPVSVTVNALPAVPVINASGPTTFCDGGSVTLTATGAGNFLWDSGQNTAAITVNNSGSYAVTLTNANGCQSSSSTTTVTELAPLSPPVVVANGSVSFCPGGSVTLQAPGASSYLWSTGATTQSITSSISNSYHVTITDINGCVSPQSADINTTLNQTPATPVISAIGNYPICQGETVQLSSSAAAQYLWSNGNITQTVSTTQAGPLSVTITDANGCISSPSAPFQVSFFPLPPQPIISAVGPSTFCSGGSVELQAVGNGTINWNNNGSGANITITLSGQYTATVTDANGCESLNSSPIQVNVIPTPQNAAISVNGPTDICFGDSVLLTSTSAPQYSWSTGSSAQSIWVYESGIYTVTVGGTTCPPDNPVASREVQVRPNPLPIITASSNRDCLPADISFTMSTEGIGPFSYLWRFGDGSTSTQANPTKEYDVAGFYDVTLTLTDVIGCRGQVSEKDFIEILPKAFPTITIYPKVTNDSEPNILLVSQNQNADSLIWDLGILGIYYGDTINITLPDTGIWPVEYTVITAAGCEVSLKDDIRMVEDFTIYVPSGFTPNEDGLNDVFLPIKRGVLSKGYEFAVFNRWGDEVFTSNKLHEGWDGKDAPIDTYIWRIVARSLLGEDKIVTGSVTIVR
ncbi:MAG: PKD domain-containing protein [Bacteroidia bacterium]